MKTLHTRTWGLTALLGSLALLGGCVATGPVGYDGYPYEYGAPHVDVDVYSQPHYRSYPAYPYYDGRPGYDRRWYGRDRPVPVPVPRAVPVPVPVPVPSGRPHGGRFDPPGQRGPRPGMIAPGVRPPSAQPGNPRADRPGRYIPGLPYGTTRPADNTRDQP